MKTCADFRELLKRDLFESLNSEQRQLLEDHLQGCRSCRREKGLLEDALAALDRWDDLPVPRNFYLYGEPNSIDSSSSVTRHWMPIAASLLMFALAGMLFWANVQVTYGEKFVAFGFGDTPPMQMLPISAQLAPAVQEALNEREQDWQERLQARLAEFDAEREERFVRHLNEALSELREEIEAVSEAEARMKEISEMESRLSERMSRETEQLKVDIQMSMSALYDSLRWQYRSDLYQVIAETNRLALAEIQQSRQTRALASALITLADAQSAYTVETTR